MAPYKVDTITIVKRTAKTVEFVIDGDDEAQVIRRKISSDCGVESISYGNSNTLDNFWVEAKDIVDEIEQSAGTEEDTETKAERIAALERGIERIINERQDAQDELEDAEADGDIAQFVIDQLKSEIDALTDEYWQYVRELEELQKPEVAAEEISEPKAAEVAEVNTRLCPADMRKLWLSQEWKIDLWIRAEDEDGNDIEISDADFDAMKNSLRGKYYIAWEQGGIEFFAEDADDSLLNAIITELSERGCMIEDGHEEWEEARNEIIIIAQDGGKFFFDARTLLEIRADGCKLKVNQFEVGEYYTPEDAQFAAVALKFDIEEYGNEHAVLHKFYQAEHEIDFDNPTGGDKVVEHLNANAPEGWTITRENDRLRVNCRGKFIAEIDRITDRDLLLPETFFKRLGDNTGTVNADEHNARIDDYLNTAYNLEGIAEELEDICDTFDDDAQIENDWHVASRISFYVDHVKRGIEGLREMIDWYKQQADFAESKAE